MQKVKVNDTVMNQLKAEVRFIKYQYANDMLMQASQNAPQGVTGQLAHNLVHEVDEDTDKIGFAESYAPYIEDGTDPFNAKLITIHLSDIVIKKLGKAIRRDRETGEILVPVWWDWADKKVGLSDPVERYRFCWNVYRKIQKDGITAQHFFSKAVNEFRKESKMKSYFGDFKGVDIR